MHIFFKQTSYELTYNSKTCIFCSPAKKKKKNQYFVLLHKKKKKSTIMRTHVIWKIEYTNSKDFIIEGVGSDIPIRENELSNKKEF